MDYARQVSEMPPLAVRAIKELAVRAHQGLPLTEGLRLESAMGHILKQTEDAREGTTAFAERRAAEFKGQ